MSDKPKRSEIDACELANQLETDINNLSLQEEILENAGFNPDEMPRIVVQFAPPKKYYFVV